MRGELFRRKALTGSGASMSWIEVSPAVDAGDDFPQRDFLSRLGRLTSEQLDIE
jgi:hypothetical protein